jgi:hypothetical protein
MGSCMISAGSYRGGNGAHTGVPNGSEGFSMVAESDGVIVSSEGEAGTFYALQLLWQALTSSPLACLCFSIRGAGQGSRLVPLHAVAICTAPHQHKISGCSAAEHCGWRSTGPGSTGSLAPADGCQRLARPLCPYFPPEPKLEPLLCGVLSAVQRPGACQPALRVCLYDY